jgi:hypothetical protein
VGGALGARLTGRPGSAKPSVPGIGGA